MRADNHKPSIASPQQPTAENRHVQKVPQHLWSLSRIGHRPAIGQHETTRERRSDIKLRGRHTSSTSPITKGHLARIPSHPYGLRFTLLAAVFTVLPSLSLPRPTKAAETANTDAVRFPPDAVAIYDGGHVAAKDVTQCLADESCRRYVEVCPDGPCPGAPPETADPARRHIDNIEKGARGLAVLQILLQTAEERKLDQTPEYRLECKFAEQRVLADDLWESLQEEARGILLTEEDITREIDTNRFAYVRASAIRAQRILISPDRHGDKAQERAAEALKLLRAGQDFTRVAARFTDDPESVTSRMYSLDQWGTKDNVRDLLNLDPGQVSDILETSRGLEIIRMEEIVLARDFSIDEARQAARREIEYRRAKQRMAELMEKAQHTFPMLVGEALLKDLEAETRSETSIRPADQTVPVAAEHERQSPEINTAADPLASDESPRPHEVAQPFLKCGRFILTEADTRLMAQQRAANPMSDLELMAKIEAESGDMIRTAELSRQLGYDQLPEVQKRIRFARDRILAHHARLRLISEWLSRREFEEERIEQYYEQEWTATIDPLLDYDALIVLVPYDENKTEQERQETLEQARERANELIALANSGASLEQLHASYPNTQLLLEQKRVVMEDSDLDHLLANVPAGTVLPQPYRDMGGWCVIRMTDYQPRQKTPYDMAKHYVVDLLRREVENELRSDFNTHLLTEKRFRLNPYLSGQTKN